MASPQSNSVVIWGASGHARVIADALGKIGTMTIAGFIDDMSPQRRGESFCGAPVLGGRECLAGLLQQGITKMVLAFGHNDARLKLDAEMAAAGFEFPVIVHPSAVVASDAQIGPGSYIGPLAAVNAGARVGRQVIVNTAAIVEHDNVVEDGVHLSPRVCLSGHVRVGRGTWIGAGAVVRDKVTIGAGAMVGMGSVVVRAVPDGAMVYGCPAVQQGTTKRT